MSQLSGRLFAGATKLASAAKTASPRVVSRFVPPTRSPSAGEAASSSSPGCGFEALGLLPDLAKAVRTLGFAEPSAAQLLAVPPLLAGKSVAFASSTGSGKTLAFLLPLFQHLRLGELAQPLLRQQTQNARRSQGNCKPRALVLVPTRDLAAQVGAVAKAISHEFRVRVRTLEAGTRLRDTRASLRDGGDLVVATPRRLLTLHRMRDVSLRNVQHVVVDEADDVLLRGFEDDLSRVLQLCPPRVAKPLLSAGEVGAAAEDEAGAEAGIEAEAEALMSPQLAFVSATLGGDVAHTIRRTWPDVSTLVTQCAHRAPENLRHELQGFEGDKLDELLRILGTSVGTSGRRALIFCRGVQSARAVQHALSEAGLAVGGCHGKMPESAKKDDLSRFLCDPPQSPLLVTTDLSARGIDFPNVQTVVNFDFPATSSLYLHRAGRTARMGATGRVISLVHSSQRRFAESLMMAVRDRSELHLVRKGDKREAEWRAKVARYGGGGGGLARARQTLATAGERLNRIQRSKRSGAARLNRAGGQPGSGRGYGRG